MPRFFALEPEQFTKILEELLPTLSRRIDSVHLHHTWRPNHAQWRGEDSVEAMWRYHVKTNGWSDIAQHVTIAPDGLIWTGRRWNEPPASARGFNGNEKVGPFMIEVVGDFDHGRDRLEGAQYDSVIHVVSRVQQSWGLAPETLRFHNSMTDQKTCPGTSVDYATLVAAVRQASSSRASPPPARPAGWAKPMYTSGAGYIRRVVEQLGEAGSSRGGEAFDAEPAESAMTTEEVTLAIGQTHTTRSAPAAEREDRRSTLTPAILAAMRPHVVNLNEGRFSSQGLFRTQAGDVDAMFANLDRAAQASDGPLRVVFWAHGGLIDEESGLAIAQQQIEWWKANEVYPIYFVWETGFLDALRQILAGTRSEAARDLFDVTDAVVARLARSLGGGKIWSAMKRSAELAVGPFGGARYVAERLRAFADRHPQVALHAVGHSAGSIFHAHFLSAAFDLGVRPFESLQLLAPAIRTDLFHEKLAPRVGRDLSIRDLTMYTMARDWEEADDVAKIYRKSLLYLIFHALEAEDESPILGLEESVRADAGLTRFFGLDGAPAPAQVVWSVTHETTGRSASTSSTHGGFDNDRPTMNAVATRILREEPRATFPDEAIERGRRSLKLATTIPPPPRPGSSADPFPTPASGFSWNGTAPLSPAMPPPPPTLAVHPNGSGARRALCVGINAYASAPLNGCVADAQQWMRVLAGLGFQCATLLDRDARRSAIVDSLQDLIARSRPGDVVVFQYAGHGTHLDDLDGDETDGQDEALCPFDIDEGAFLIDDDVAAIMAGIPAGVNVTCFLDCCHSGTATRFAVGPVRGTGVRGASRARFLTPTRGMQEQHRAFRARVDVPRAVSGRTEADMRNVVFAACQDSQVAWETGGQGEFTVRALGVLAAGLAGVSHEEFERRVTAAFGANPRQHPRLDCAPDARRALLLAPLAATPLTGSASSGANGARPGEVELSAILAEGLRGVADAILARR